MERHKATNLPRTTKGLKAWLRGSEEGRRLFAELASEFLEMRCRDCQERRPFPKVLIVLRRLGLYPGAEVYAEKGVLTRFVEMPDLPDDGTLGPMLEEFIEASLPRNWRHMTGLPSKRIHGDVFRGLSVEEMASFADCADCIREIGLVK